MKEIAMIVAPPHSSRCRAGVILVVALLMGSTLPATARATGTVGVADGSGAVEDDNIEARVRYDDPGAAGATGCAWNLVTGVDPVTGSTREQNVSRVRNGVREILYERACATSHSLHWIRDDAAPRIAKHAENTVSRLVPALLTRTAPPHDKMVVNVGTWYWVPKAAWKPVSVRAFVATPAGPIIVTVTARPSRLLYSPGDGGRTVSCRGPGRPWRRSFGDAAVTPCMYTYRRSSHRSSSGSYRARMSVRWSVSWTSNLGIGSPLPSITTGIGLRAVVRELQALTR